MLKGFGCRSNAWMLLRETWNEIATIAEDQLRMPGPNKMPGPYKMKTSRAKMKTHEHEFPYSKETHQMIQ
ncbi:hypothetical protein E6C60_3254 [Paenibacillus algicola]|uniref:Transposase n=1 Tax=Paenibacillus algicola TaxID=2565926 RepID=A0A4P8XNW1_9BACL|nr:hypothetical protein E6C60_3254 [Paenibacillus algicola]